jgi:hypothetical protein
MPNGPTAGPHRGAGRCSGKRFHLSKGSAARAGRAQVTVDWKDGQMLSFGAGRAKGESRSGRKVRKRVHLGRQTRSERSRLVKRRSDVPECELGRSRMLARTIENASLVEREC